MKLIRLASYFSKLLIAVFLSSLVRCTLSFLNYAKLQCNRGVVYVEAATKASAVLINDKVPDWVSALQALSTSNFRDAARMREFHEQARPTLALAVDQNWDDIALYAPTAAQVLNLRLSSNSPVATVKGNPAIILRASQTGQDAVLDTFFGRNSQKNPS